MSTTNPPGAIPTTDIDLYLGKFIDPTTTSNTIYNTIQFAYICKLSFDAKKGWITDGS